METERAEPHIDWFLDKTDTLGMLSYLKIKERDKAQQKAASSGCLQDWQYYKSLRNTINKSLKLEKKKWQSSKLEGFGNDSKTVWKNLKSWLGWSKTISTIINIPSDMEDS